MGRTNFLDKLYMYTLAPLGIGFMIGPWIAGIIVTETQSYLGAKLLAGASLAVGGTCSVVAGWVTAARVRPVKRAVELRT